MLCAIPATRSRPGPETRPRANLVPDAEMGVRRRIVGRRGDDAARGDLRVSALSRARSRRGRWSHRGRDLPVVPPLRPSVQAGPTPVPAASSTTPKAPRSTKQSTIDAKPDSLPAFHCHPVPPPGLISAQADFLHNFGARRNAKACCARKPVGNRVVQTEAARLARGGGTRCRTASPRRRAWWRSSAVADLDGVMPAVHLGPVEDLLQPPGRTSMFAWMYMPQTASRVSLISATWGAAPSSTMGANSMVWLIRISSACEREPDSQSTSAVAWCASWMRQSSGAVLPAVETVDVQIVRDDEEGHLRRHRPRADQVQTRQPGRAVEPRR